MPRAHSSPGGKGSRRFPLRLPGRPRLRPPGLKAARRGRRGLKMPRIMQRSPVLVLKVAGEVAGGGGLVWSHLATNALGIIMSLLEAAEVVSNKFPPLLPGLITQIYFLQGESELEVGRKSGLMKPLSSAVQALQGLILCTGQLEEYQALGKKGCWKMLLSPDRLFEVISHLVGTLFTLSSTQLKLMYQEANTYTRHSDLKVKTIGMAFFSKRERTEEELL